MARGAHPFRISEPAAASLLVNGLLIAALLNLGMGQVGRRSETPALTVLSLAVPKGVEQGEEKAQMASPAPTADEPPARPTQSKADLAIAASVAPPIVALPSRIAMTMANQPVASAAPPAAAPSVQPSASAPPAAAPTPRRGAADGLDVQAPPGNSRSYAARVRSWLYAHKVYPRRARMRREEGQVQVRFILDRAGVLLDGAIIHSSGNAVLDEEAKAMLRRASPFPQAPAELPGEHIEFTAPIMFALPA